MAAVRLRPEGTGTAFTEFALAANDQKVGILLKNSA
jgi:hypothetical protein